MATTLLQQQTPVILTSPYTLRPDVATGSSTALDDFHLLVQQIKTYLGSSSGIDSKDIDVDILKTLMLRYTSNSVHWNKYAKVQPGKHYTRNSIENINGKANILLLVWNPEKGSPVHDHADAHCVMKILQGNLKEEIFGMPSLEAIDGSPLVIKKETIYNPDEVTYISDNIGLHRISNPSKTDVAISLHLYTPPNAADFGYNIYDEKTGKCSHVSQASTA